MTIDETSQADASVSTETVTNPTPPNAREMVLDLLTTHDAHELPLKALVRAGNLFGYTDQTVRVALSRLKADGVIASPARGVHALAAVEHAAVGFGVLLLDARPLSQSQKAAAHPTLED